MVRTGQDVQAVFTDIPDRPGLDAVTPVARMVIDSFTNEDVDAVFVAYADFVNTTMQRPTVTQLLPVVPAELEATQAVGYIYEPDERPVLDALLPRYVEMQLYHYLLEGIASEQSARMVAMRNATDNANEMVGDLTLIMNKARQETITKELLDIVGGVAAVRIITANYALTWRNHGNGKGNPSHRHRGGRGVRRGGNAGNLQRA